MTEKSAEPLTHEAALRMALQDVLASKIDFHDFGEDAAQWLPAVFAALDAARLSQESSAQAAQQPAVPSGGAEPQRWWDAHRQGLIERLREGSPRGGGRHRDRHPWITMQQAADELSRLADDLNAGREWIRCAWNELVAIRARDGAPPGVSEEWWDEMTEGLSNLLGDAAKPWMLGAARELVRPYERKANEWEDHARTAEAALDAERAAHRETRDLYNASVEVGVEEQEGRQAAEARVRVLEEALGWIAGESCWSSPTPLMTAQETADFYAQIIGEMQRIARAALAKKESDRG